MTILGTGIAGCGTCIVGFGEIVPYNSTVSKLFRLPEDLNLQGNAVALDTKTGDVIRDQETGIHMGMIDTQQLVYTALRTLKYSSSVTDFGLDFTSQIINQSTIQKLQNAVSTALQFLINQNKIQIIELKVSRPKQNALSCLVRWKDISTNKILNFNITI